MHDAFQSRAVVERLPLSVEAIATWGDKLILSTDKGPLLVYSIGGGEAPQLLESKKAFSKKPTTQLCVVEELGILVSLSDGLVSVHDLAHFNLKFSLNKTRGASLFAVDIIVVQQQQQQQQRYGAGGSARSLPAGSSSSLLAKQPSSAVRVRLCVVVKKKLMTFEWEGDSFVEDRELNTPEVARALAWCDDYLCVGFKKEYNMIHSDTGGISDLFPTGKNGEPLITKLPNKELLLQKDHISIFIGYDGKPTRKFGISWSDVPVYLDLVTPYIVGLLPRSVEIRTIETQMLIQTIELPKSLFLAQSQSVYVASTTHVWHLIPIPLQNQIERLIDQREYEEALNLASLLKDVSEADKIEQIRRIKSLHAYSLFEEHHFEQSLAIFSELDEDPPHVVGLYPDLLPEELRRQMNYPIPLPKFERAELDKAKLALIEFLTQKRNRLVKTVAESSQDEMIRKEWSQIIDTSLLKCYLDTNPALVGPLLRVENYCHVGESEKMLKRLERYSELVMLYQGKGLHRKALELLFKESQNPASPLKGHLRTVGYLQKLGSEHLDLILEYSRWVLMANPEEGLKIFTEDTKEIDSLPHDKVLEHLEAVESKLQQQQVSATGFQESRLVLPYLEHIIDNCKAVAPDFHNKRVLYYFTAVQSLKKETSVGQFVPAGSEPGLLGVYRRKLIGFLEKSKFYKPPFMLSRFPQDDLFEERALLLGRLNRHEQALNIYVTKLHNTQMAEQYCANNYNPEIEGQKDVYLSLLKVYLRTPDVYGEGAPTDTEPMIDQALALLVNHSAHIDTPKALELLPSNIPIRGLEPFFEAVLRDRTEVRRAAQVLKNLQKAEQLQVQEQLIHYQAKRVVISEDRMCPVCNKRIANSVFAYYPNGVIVHYGCMKDRNVCPV